LTLREGERLVAIWPLVIYRRGGLRIVQELGSESSEYTSPLSEPGPQRSERMATLWQAATALGDLFVAGQVRGSDPFAEFLQRHRFRCFKDNQISAPWIAFKDYKGWTEYLETVSGYRLKGLRRMNRRLAEQGEVVFRVEPSPISDTLIERVLELKSAWMERRGVSNDWLERPEYRAFLAALTSNAESRDGLSLFSLQLNGTPIAFQLSAVDRKRVEFLIGTFDAQWARFSPGELLMRECLRWACERGLDFDFRIGAEAYKFAWARRNTLCFDWKVGLNARGLAAVWLLRLQWLRHRINRQSVARAWGRLVSFYMSRRPKWPAR
jgi:CelD/BcsL family acetyltransferase involved in cellulose biosynthesis